MNRFMYIFILAATLASVGVATDAQAKWSKEKCEGYRKDMAAIENWLKSFSPNTSSKHRAAYNKGVETLNRAKRDYAKNC